MITLRLSDRFTSTLNCVETRNSIRWWILNHPLTIQKHLYHSVTCKKSPKMVDPKKFSKNTHIPRVEITRLELNKDAMKLFKHEMAEKYPENKKKIRKQRTTTMYKNKHGLYPK